MKSSEHSRNMHFSQNSTKKEKNPRKKWDYSFFKDLIFGGVSGGISKTVVAPLERCKLIMQIQKNHHEAQFKSSFRLMVHLVRQEGFFSLWRGNLPNVLRYVPNQALLFAFKDSLRPIFNNYDPEREFWKLFCANLFCSGVAGGLSLLAVYPLDFLRTRMALDLGRMEYERQFEGFRDCVQKIYRYEGISGLYRGFGMSVQGFILYKGAALGGYDTLKSVFPQDNSLLSRLIMAQVSNITTGFISYPWDTVSRRMMMETGRSERLYKGGLDCAFKILKNEGPKSFFNGFVSNAFRCIGGSLVLVVYDELQAAYSHHQMK